MQAAMFVMDLHHAVIHPAFVFCAQVISVDVPQYDSQFAAAKKSNFQLLNRILGGVTHALRRVSDPLDLLGAFKAKEYSATAYYSGPFRIADTMTIKVKVAGA